MPLGKGYKKGNRKSRKKTGPNSMIKMPIAATTSRYPKAKVSQ